MAIVRLLRATLYGAESEKARTLDAVQTLGCMHLVDLSGNAGPGTATVERSADARAALRYLQESPVTRRAPARPDAVDVAALVREVLEVRDRARALAEESVQLARWIEDREPWGDFSIAGWPLDDLELWFYKLPHYRLNLLDALEAPWRIVGRDHRFGYVVVVAAEPPAALPVAPESMDPRSLSELRQRLDAVEREREALDYQRIGLTLHAGALERGLAEADDLAVRESAAQRVLERDRLFALQGWVPSSRAEALRAFATERGLALTLAPPAPDDRPPTLLDNPPVVRGGEDLVSFYTTPAYGSWDPSRVVMVLFAFFFAMILADAGYAAVLGAIAWAVWQRLGASESGRGLRTVMATVTAFSIVYGIIVGSYFGVAPRDGTLARALVLVDATDQQLMMWLSIGIGALHLAGANGVVAWQRRGRLSALAPLGWAAVILGGLGLGLARNYASLAVLDGLAQGALALGAVLVLLFSSERAFSLHPKALALRLFDGVKGATQLTKAFGDVLSYLRLFALGLAALKLAEVFNGLAASAFEVPGVGLLLGVLILVAGHGLNFVMGIMSGVVHSLRLNFIEFFSWSLPEEGERFVKFERKSASDREDR